MAALRSIAMLALLASIAGDADADSLVDYFGPRDVALGESMRGAAQGALSITLNPAGVALDRQLVFDGTWSHRGSDGASVIAVSACDSTVPVPGCFYYRYFGAEPSIAGEMITRRTHEFGSTLARALTSQLYAGVNVRYFDYNSDLPGEADQTGFASDLGVTFRASQAFSVGLVGYNLVAADSAQYPLGVGGGLALRPLESLGIAADAVWNLERDEGNGKGRYGAGAEYFLRSSDGQSGYPVRLGGVYDALDRAGYVSGGLGFSNVKLGLDVSARRQVKGGDDFAILAGLRVFGPSGQ